MESTKKKNNNPKLILTTDWWLPEAKDEGREKWVKCFLFSIVFVSCLNKLNLKDRTALTFIKKKEWGGKV